MRTKKWIAWMLCAALSMGTFLPAVKARAVQESSGAAATEQTEAQAGGSYEKYQAAHGGLSGPHPDTVIDISAADCLDYAGNATLTTYMDNEDCLLWDMIGSRLSWRFEVEQEGWYQLAVTYCTLEGKGGDIILDVLLDGQVPYENAANINLHRLYMDETYHSLTDNAFATNAKGDELRPALVEQFVWQTCPVLDAKGQYPGALMFYLEKGSHEVALKLNEEAIAIGSLQFRNEAQAEPYEDVLLAWDAAGAKDTAGYFGAYEAEKSYKKNALTLFPTYDTAQVHVTPSSPYTVNYNTIGKNTWKDVGQAISWEFEVPEDGYYYLAFKVKQYDKTNAYSTRAVRVDGEMLYAEMGVQKFAYATGWYVQRLQSADGTPLKVYLKAGIHVLEMEAVLDAEFASVLRQVDEVTRELQDWYREIVKVTGFNADADRVSVDTNRDFNLEKSIPGLLEGLQSCKDRLETYYAQIGEMDCISSASVSVLQETATVLGQLIRKPGKIAKRIDTLRSNISNISTMTIELRSQPLMMDKFFVYSPEQKTPEVGGGFFQQLVYRFKMFLHSFSGANTAISGNEEEAKGNTTIRVWISTADITTTGASSGRDQAIILKKLIDESFTPKYGVNVEVSLVSGSDTLVQAVLAGKGPDAALFTAMDTPANLAMRDVALDLSQFDGFEETANQFTKSAMTPFYYKDGCYAFPETQNFNMVFYRTDVFAELGLTPPETWDEFYEQIVVLYNNNYMVGVPQNQNIFETFLYQSGTTFYTEDLTRSTFDSNEALKAFAGWTDLYTKYSLPLVFDFFNRFRSGEMAMGIMPYNQVNYLYSAAPELDGLWDLAMIPGTVDASGNINRVETSSSTGCVGLRKTEHPQEVFDFLSWWVSEDTQTQFGIQVEQTMGIAARYATANPAAFEKLPWTTHQADMLRQQRANTVAVEQIPGSYYIARNLSFAFRAVVYSNANQRETLYKYNIEINKELERKQKEFNY